MSTKRPPPLPPAIPGVSKKEMSWHDEHQPSRPPPRKSSKPRQPSVSPATKGKPPGMPIGAVRSRTATIPFAVGEHALAPTKKIDARVETTETPSQSPEQRTIEILQQRIKLLETLVQEKDELRSHLMVMMTEIIILHDPPGGKKSEMDEARKGKRRVAEALTYLVRALVETLREDGELEALLKHPKFRAELAVLSSFFHV